MCKTVLTNPLFASLTATSPVLHIIARVPKCFPTCQDHVRRPYVKLEKKLEVYHFCAQ